jgi:hypothetical protein
MKPTITVISKENKKALEALRKLHEAKSSLREYIAKGGSVKDYNPKKKRLD